MASDTRDSEPKQPGEQAADESGSTPPEVVESVGAEASAAAVAAPAEPADDGIPEPVVEHVAEPADDGIPEPVIEHAAEPADDGIPEPVIEHAAEPADDGIPEPVVEEGAESAAAEGAGEDIEMLDLDEDDIEMLDLDEDDMVAEDAGPPPPPPTPPAPPPTPAELGAAASVEAESPAVPVPGEAGAEEAEGAAPITDEAAGADVAIDFDEGASEDAAAAPAAEGVAPRELQEPSPLDIALDEAINGTWEQRAERLTQELETASDRVRVGALAYELGELYARHLDDEARAVQAFGRALKEDPSLRANLWAIRRVFYRRGLWPNLLKLIDAEIRFARDDVERASLAVEKGHILADQTNAPDEARAAFEQALSFDASSISALLALERRALAAGDVDAQLALWRKLVDASELPERKLGYLRDMIRVLRKRGDEGLDKARELMDEAVALGVDAERVAVERQRLAEQAGDAEALLFALDSRVKHLLARFGEHGLPEAPQVPRAAGSELDHETAVRLQIAALRRRQSRLAREQLDDSQRAWAYLEHALEVAPGEPLVVGDLADLAEALGKFEALAGLCLRLQALETSKERHIALELRRADALARAGKRQDARQHLDDLASENPGYLPVTALAERSALSAGDWQALAQAATASAEAAQLGNTFGSGGSPDKAAAAAGYVVAGDLHAYFLDDGTRAHTLYGQALEMVAGYPPAVDALATLHELHGRADDAAELLELHSELGDERFRYDVLERLSRIYDEQGKLDESLATLRRLSALAPDDDRLRWRIEELLAVLGQGEERAAMLRELADRTDNSDRRAAILLEVARIFDEELDDPTRALEAYRSVLDIWPTDRYTRAAVASLLRRSGRWDDLVVERRAEAEQLDDGPQAARALREAGAVLLERLGRPGEAVEVYRTLLDRAPSDTHAARALRDALTRAGDHDALLEVAEREAESQSEPGALAASLVRLAEAQLAAAREDDAFDSYRRASEADSRSMHAQLGLWQLAAKRRDAKALTDVLERVGRTRANPELASELLEEAGWLAASALDDEARALAAFGEAARLSPARVGPHLGSALVHGRRADTDEQLASLTQLAELTGPAGAGLWLRAAAVREVGGDAEGAAKRVTRALELAPGDPGALLVAAERPPALANGDGAAWRSRAELLRARAGLCDDPATRDHWDLETAQALERAGQLHDAGRVVAEVLGRSPEDVRALQALRRICRAGEDRAGLARASLALARVLGDRDAQLSLLREAAAIFDAELADLHAAVPIYRRIVALEPSAVEYQRLHDIFERHEDQGGLYELLTERIDRLDDDRLKVPLWFERAGIRQALDDKRGAARDLQSVLDVDSGHLGALRALASVVLELGFPKQAASLLRQFLDLCTDPAERAQAELQLSQILAETMDDASGALAQLDAVLEQNPADVGLRERVVSLLLRAGDAERAVRELRELEKLRTQPAERARDELRIAALLRDRLGNAARAQKSLIRARQLDPLNIDAVRELADLVGEGEDRRKVLVHGASDARVAVAEMPQHVPAYQRLAVIAQWMGDDDTRYFALAALDALSTVPSEHKAFYASHGDAVRNRVVKPSGEISADDWQLRLQHPRAGGFAADLWAMIAEGVARTMPHDPAQLGFGRGDRVGRHLERDYPLVDAFARAFGVGTFELYVSADKERYARVVSLDKPAIFLSSDVATPKTAAAAFALGRALAMARDRSGSLAELRPDEIVGLFAAAARIAGIDPGQSQALAGASGDAQEDRERALAKALGRRDRKNLSLASSRFSELEPPTFWARATLATASRAGVLMAGDLGAALEMLDVGRAGRALTDDEWALDLLAWAVGQHHIALRAALGIGG